MKKKILFFLLIILNLLLNSISIKAERIVNHDQTEIKNEKIYVIGENKPFSGIVKSYYDNGKLDTEYLVKEGLQNGMTKLYYETGELEAEYFYVNGLINGTVKSYYKNGNLDSESTYVDDILTGITKLYYETGELEAECPYENNNLHGIVKHYKKNGKLDEKNFYVDGIIVDEKDYNAYLKNEITKEEIHSMYDDNSNKENKKQYFSKYFSLLGILFFIFPILIILSILKIVRALPSFKSLDEYQKELILKKILKYNNNNKTNLHSTFRLNGFGTGFYKIGSIKLDNEKINIYAKMLSALYIPMPFISGYIVCRGKTEIISTISKEDFESLKREIQEEIL